MNPFEQYLQELRNIRATGATVKETSYYNALANLLNTIGATLKPEVRCFMQLKNLGAGMPDGGFFTQKQYERDSAEQPTDPQNPERGVIEIKSSADDAWLTAQTPQITQYWKKYRQVLVTNYRDFVLIGQDAEGRPIVLETYRLAANEKEFWQKAQRPQTFAKEHEEQITEYLKRVMLQQSTISSAQDLAWFLASYAKDARARINKSDQPTLTIIREALEEALGIRFEHEKGLRFFKSTLIQTLFYGLFSAWVLWHKQGAKGGRFDWKVAAWSLHVPMVKALFEKVATPTQLGRLDLVELLDWTGEALNRVDRVAFFATFNEGEAVQYFYEPFLEAFDPDLRKELGVWYTPNEIVQYMVARVDTVLREELGIEDGLADESVYILDPCCGTGAFLVEVLRRIHQTLVEKGDEALIGSYLKRAAKERVLGFEILTAPFVVAHLQLGLLLQHYGVAFQSETERVGVYLTNALTGWEPPNEDAKARYRQLAFSYPELDQERESADAVKRKKPILVVLGNPPYNAFAGISAYDEKGLVAPYKEGLITHWGIKRFNLDDLYVRFFGLAERCIVQQQPGKGVVCFVSNFSYLSDPSFVVMRQRLLNGFDKLWFDCMNGDSRETGKVTPDGKPDPSIFSSEYNRAGIRVGTTIALMVRQGEKKLPPSSYFRHFWGSNKRKALLNSLQNDNFDQEYILTQPEANNRFTFRPSNISAEYLSWPKLTTLCAVAPSNGLMEKRGGALIDIDPVALETRMRAYFNSGLDWESYKGLNYGLVKPQAGFEPKKVREKLLLTESYQPNQLVRYIVRPFDRRWCYYSAVNPLWNSHRPFLWKQCWEGNKFLLTRFKGAKDSEGVPFYFTSCLSDDHLLTPDAIAIPLQLMNGARLRPKEQLSLIDILGGKKPHTEQPFANLSAKARQYLNKLQLPDPDEDTETAQLIWMHALAIGYAPAYLTENKDGICQDFPHIPLPNHRERLLASAELGRELGSYLDTEAKVKGVTVGAIRPILRGVGGVTKVGGGMLNEDELLINAGWGHAGREGTVMPGKGNYTTRDYSAEELLLIDTAAQRRLGKKTVDVYLNEVAYWKNIPLTVWEYTIGGYQLLKKWLSYREGTVINRPITVEESQQFREIVRRIAAILLFGDQLDANYEAVKHQSYDWGNNEGE